MSLEGQYIAKNLVIVAAAVGMLHLYPSAPSAG